MVKLHSSEAFAFKMGTQRGLQWWSSGHWESEAVWGGWGMGEVDGTWGQAAVILEPLKSLQGTAQLSVFNAFTHVPHGTALAILSEG